MNENEWTCPVCGGHKREPVEIVEPLYNGAIHEVKSYDFYRSISACSNCKLIFAIGVDNDGYD